MYYKIVLSLLVLAILIYSKQTAKPYYSYLCLNKPFPSQLKFVKKGGNEALMSDTGDICRVSRPYALTKKDN